MKNEIYLVLMKPNMKMHNLKVQILKYRKIKRQIFGSNIINLLCSF